MQAGLAPLHAPAARELAPCIPSVQINHPRLVKGVKDAHIARVAAGGNHTLLLASTGEVFSCGDGSFGGSGPPVQTRGVGGWGVGGGPET